MTDDQWLIKDPKVKKLQKVHKVLKVQKIQRVQKEQKVQSLATTIQYQRYRLVYKDNPSFESCVEGKSRCREILCTLGVPSLKQQHQTSSDQLCLCKNCTVIEDLKGAPAVHFNFPLQSVSLYFTLKNGIAASGEPIPLE